MNRDQRAERDDYLDQHDLDDGPAWVGPNTLVPTPAEAEKDANPPTRR